MTAPRKERTSSPQDHPIRPDDPRLRSRIARRGLGTKRKTVTLARGLRMRDSETSLEVIYGDWRWTTRMLIGVALVTGLVCLFVGWLLR